MYKIMIVDDNAMNLDILKDILHNEYKLSMAKNGMIALKILGKQTPDLILLDIMMPVMDGYELFSHLNGDERLSTIPVIFLSGVDKLDKSIIDAAPKRYISLVKKPFDVDEVKLRIVEALNSRGN